MENQIEVWKDVIGFEGYYEAHLAVEQKIKELENGRNS